MDRRKEKIEQAAREKFGPYHHFNTTFTDVVNFVEQQLADADRAAREECAQFAQSAGWINTFDRHRLAQAIRATIDGKEKE